MSSRELAWRSYRAPEGAFTLALQVRSYEVMRDGSISLATLLRYLEYIATEASAFLGFDYRWYESHGCAWVVREMSLALGRLPGIDDELRLATWLSEYRRVQAVREYAVWNVKTGRQVARARARWAYIDRVRGTPLRIHDEILARFPLLGAAMPPVTPRAGTTAGQAATHSAELTAREYEADTQQHVNNCVYADWLYDALHSALAAAPPLTSGGCALPRRYAIEYARPTLPGQVLQIETRLQRADSRLLVATQQIVNRDAGTTMVRAYSEHLLAARTDS